MFRVLGGTPQKSSFTSRAKNKLIATTFRPSHLNLKLTDPSYISGCQNYGPFLGALNIRCRIRIGYPKKGA